MWLVYYKPTSLVMAPAYGQYYNTRADAFDAIEAAGLKLTDCEVCPLCYEEDFTYVPEEARS